MAAFINKTKKRKEYEMPNDEFGLKALVEGLEELEDLIKQEEAEKDPEAKRAILEKEKDLIEKLLKDPRLDDAAKELLAAQLARVKDKLGDPEALKEKGSIPELKAALAQLSKEANQDLKDAPAAAKPKIEKRLDNVDKLGKLADDEEEWDVDRAKRGDAPVEKLIDNLQAQRKAIDALMAEPAVGPQERRSLEKKRDDAMRRLVDPLGKKRTHDDVVKQAGRQTVPRVRDLMGALAQEEDKLDDQDDPEFVERMRKLS